MNLLDAAPFPARQPPVTFELNELRVDDECVGFVLESLFGDVQCKYEYPVYDAAKDAIIPERDTLYIEYVEVKEAAQKHGVGTQLVAAALAKARDEGYSLGRASVTNPYSVKLLERLKCAGQLSEVAYIRKPDTYVPQLPTLTVLEAENRVTPENAAAFLEAADELSNPQSMVICAFRF